MSLVRPGGAAADVEVTPPTTLRALLEGEDVRAFDFDYLDLEGATTTRLTRAQAFADVAVAAEGDGLRIGDIADVRAITLGEGSPLIVTGRADDASVRAGDEIRFSAAVAGLRDGQAARVRWTFPGGERVTGTRARHTFAKAGNYVVVVGVTTPGDRAGASDTVVVKVGDAPAADPSPSPSPAPVATTPPAVGSGGGDPVAGGGPSPSKAGATPTPTPTATPAATAKPRGTLVAGELLDAPGGGGGSEPQPAATPVKQAAGDVTVPPGVVGAAAAALLAAAGFRLDMRRARPGWR